MRAVCDVFPKLIFLDNTYNQETNFMNTIPNFESIRNDAVTKLFLKMNLTSNIEAINNINNACIEILENRSILEFILSDETILRHIFDNLSKNLNSPENSEFSSYNYKEILVLLLNILRDSIVDNIKVPRISSSNLEGETTDVETVNTEPVHKNSLLGDLILENLGKILENFVIIDPSYTPLDTTFGVSTRTIGIRR
jgi:hypothetical protein